MRSDVCRAERAVLRGLEAGRVRYLRAFQRRWRDADPAAVNGLTPDEGVAIGHGHGIHVVRVHKVDVSNVGVEDIHVADERVVYVDDGDEIPAATKPREKRFAEAQREPADTESKSAAEEANKSGAIDRRPKKRAGAPAPPAREIVPAAVVIRSKAPGRIVNPSPAPGANPVPIAIAVGSPVGCNFARIPDVTVFRFIAPVAVIIQIAVARRIARNVLAGNGVVFLEVALGGPAVEAVRSGRPFKVRLNVVRASKFGALLKVDR